MFGPDLVKPFRCSTLNRLLRTAVAYRGSPESGRLRSHVCKPPAFAQIRRGKPLATCSDLPHAQNSRGLLASSKCAFISYYSLIVAHSPYGRGAGVGRGLGVGVDLGVSVAVGVGVAVAVAVGVGVGLPQPVGM
jgi:hypothetical protein